MSPLPLPLPLLLSLLPLPPSVLRPPSSRSSSLCLLPSAFCLQTHLSHLFNQASNGIPHLSHRHSLERIVLLEVFLHTLNSKLSPARPHWPVFLSGSTTVFPLRHSEKRGCLEDIWLWIACDRSTVQTIDLQIAADHRHTRWQI